MKKTIVCLVIMVLLLSFAGCSKKESPNKSDGNSSSAGEMILVQEPEPIDVDSSLKEMGEVLSHVSADRSKSNVTGKEAVSISKDRGFQDSPIQAEYTMDGEYLGEELTEDTDAQSPFYETYYTDTNGEIWTIDIVNGRITAYPVTYNKEGDHKTTIIFSETETLYSYDSVSNTFFEFDPDGSVLKVVVIDRIDAKTLDSITKDEMDRYKQ